MNELNDRETVEVLERCTGRGRCMGCPLYEPKNSGSCVMAAMRAALRIIKRQEDELARFREEIAEKREDG